MKFMSKPVEIDAEQWDGTEEGARRISEWMDGERKGDVPPGLQVDQADPGQALLWTEKSERWIPIVAGTWVIAERDGVGYYPCVADQFAERYESVTVPSEVGGGHVKVIDG